MKKEGIAKTTFDVCHDRDIINELGLDYNSMDEDGNSYVASDLDIDIFKL